MDDGSETWKPRSVERGAPFEVVVVSAKIGTARENIGDILSARALSEIFCSGSAAIVCLPKEHGMFSMRRVLYGGGGMIRPAFSEREVHADMLARHPSVGYAVCGIGVNSDLGSKNYSSEDLRALSSWLRNAEFVVVRDWASRRFVREKLDAECNVRPCPSFSVLRGTQCSEPSRKRSLGIVVSFGHTKTYERFLPKVVRFVEDACRLLGRESIGLICHDAADEKAARMYFPGVLSVRPKSFVDVKSVYLGFRSIISFRGHGVIFAAACGCACSTIPLSDKIESLFQYHYNREPIELSFSVRKHIDFLSLTTSFHVDSGSTYEIAQ